MSEVIDRCKELGFTPLATTIDDAGKEIYAKAASNGPVTVVDWDGMIEVEVEVELWGGRVRVTHHGPTLAEASASSRKSALDARRMFDLAIAELDSLVGCPQCVDGAALDQVAADIARDAVEYCDEEPNA